MSKNVLFASEFEIFWALSDCETHFEASYRTKMKGNVLGVNQ